MISGGFACFSPPRPGFQGWQLTDEQGVCLRQLALRRLGRGTLVVDDQIVIRRGGQVLMWLGFQVRRAEDRDIGVLRAPRRCPARSGRRRLPDVTNQHPRLPARLDRGPGGVVQGQVIRVFQGRKRKTPRSTSRRSKLHARNCRRPARGCSTRSLKASPGTARPSLPLPGRRGFPIAATGCNWRGSLRLRSTLKAAIATLVRTADSRSSSSAGPDCPAEKSGTAAKPAVGAQIQRGPAAPRPLAPSCTLPAFAGCGAGLGQAGAARSACCRSLVRWVGCLRPASAAKQRAAVGERLFRCRPRPRS